MEDWRLVLLGFGARRLVFTFCFFQILGFQF